MVQTISSSSNGKDKEVCNCLGTTIIDPLQLMSKQKKIPMKELKNAVENAYKSVDQLIKVKCTDIYQFWVIHTFNRLVDDGRKKDKQIH